MKTMICVLLVAAWSIPSIAQKIATDKVPSQVQAAFKAKYASVEKVQWEMEDQAYEAEFTLNKEEMSASFQENGTWIETETEISTKDLPAAVKKSIEANFAGYKIEEVCKIQHVQKGSGFEAELEKGQEELEVFFTPTGEVVSKVAEKDDDSDDKDD